jgi:hypothetical protein
MEGKDEMTKASGRLQDLRRGIYVKAKAEPFWRFWGLYVHVCKMAKKNNGAPGIDGVTFEDIEARGAQQYIEQIRNELTERTYVPLRARKKEIPKDPHDGGQSLRRLVERQVPPVHCRQCFGVLEALSRQKILAACTGSSPR